MIIGTDLWRLIVLEKALKLEVMGMIRSRRPSAYTTLKKEFKFKGRKSAVHKQVCAKIEELKDAQLCKQP